MAMTVLSIVTPVYNAWSFTRSFIESVRASLEGADRPDGEVELIIVDNGSTDETPTELAKIQWPGLRVLRPGKNLGFAAGSNLGAREARGRWLVFLNNDMLALPGSLRALLDAIRSSDAVGAVGGRLLYADHTIQHAGIVFSTGLRPIHAFRGFPAEHPLVLVRRELQAVTGACLTIERELFVSLGLFDEEYRNGYEDVDLCMKVREKGKQVVYDPGAVFFHYESKSQGRFRKETPNRKRFRARWRSRLASDEKEMTLAFAHRVRDALKAEVEAALASGSPYLSVPYARWSDDPRARDLARKMAHLIACEETLRRADGSLDLLRMSWNGPFLDGKVLGVKKSTIYRVSRAVTWLPRRILGPYV